MRRILIIIVNILFVCSITIAQTIDSASLICLYNTKYINNIQNPLDVKNEEMVLLIGDKFSGFYSYTSFYADSLLNANPEEYKPKAVTNGGHTQILPPSKRAPKASYHDKLYIERSSGRLSCLTKILTQNYQYNEQLAKPEWKVENGTIEMLGYCCQKATTNYKGRTWFVWFASEIPISEGPWKLRGLPGLILKAEDSEKHYSFECVGIERLTSQRRPIIKDNKLIYQTVTKKDYDRLYTTYFNNPSAYLEGIFGGNISVRTPKGEKEYNPIEK